MNEFFGDRAQLRRDRGSVLLGLARCRPERIKGAQARREANELLAHEETGHLLNPVGQRIGRADVGGGGNDHADRSQISGRDAEGFRGLGSRSGFAERDRLAVGPDRDVTGDPVELCPVDS